MCYLSKSMSGEMYTLELLCLGTEVKYGGKMGFEEGWA